MPGLSGSRWASKSSQEPTAAPATSQPPAILWQKEYLESLTAAAAAAPKPAEAAPVPEGAPAPQVAPAAEAPMFGPEKPVVKLPAAPEKAGKVAPSPPASLPPASPTAAAAPAKPCRSGLMASRHAMKYSPLVAAPADPKASNGKRAKEQVYTLPPWAGLAKDEYYGLVQRCAGKTTTKSEWAVLAEGVKDARPAGTWGADWRTKGC